MALVQALVPREREPKLSILQMDRGDPQHSSHWCPERERVKLLTLKPRETSKNILINFYRAFNLDKDVFIHQANHPLTVLSSVVMGDNGHTLAEDDKRPCFRVLPCYLERVSSGICISWISAPLPVGAMKHQLLCDLMDLITLSFWLAGQCMSLKATNMQHCKCSIATSDCIELDHTDYKTLPSEYSILALLQVFVGKNCMDHVLLHVDVNYLKSLS
ncbi:LOW QUALITY PROTEIN: C11orf40 isoform 1 [Pan troglodytes]|uniref:C11orf40 isoform 1 n=1 Tax=Pan troglodytes TaxID=9598 RepID=A0A2J8P6X6_PANTR|nr:LOW QUALITY PROTEIN: C11orf40 isoform 1 [Pan troglodytes]